MGYTKLFEELIKSSIWGQDDQTRIVWITLLASKDRYHFVRGTEEWLGRAARVSPEACRRALKKLMAPDPQSHYTEQEGRRIIEVPGGWVIVSGEYYAKKLNEAERRAYKAAKQAEYRSRKKQVVDAGTRDGGREAVNDSLAGDPSDGEVVDLHEPGE